jgi:hypothetical protein
VFNKVKGTSYNYDYGSSYHRKPAGN